MIAGNHCSKFTLNYDTLHTIHRSIDTLATTTTAMTTPSTVLFDLDLTLCERTQSQDELLADSFATAGVEQYCRPADLAAVVDDVPTATSDVEFYRFCLEAAAERLGADSASAGAVARAYDELLDHSAVSFLPGAEAALELARESGRVGLVTNGSRETQLEKLEALGIADAFDVAVYADPDNGIHPKPKTVPFERALSALNADPDGAIHVGDSLAADVAGAHAAGLDSVWVPYDSPDEAGDHSPTHTLETLAEFETVL